MKNRLLVLICSITLGYTMTMKASKPITIKEIVQGYFYPRSAGYDIRSMPDGKSYTLMNDKRNAILRYSFATGKLIDTLFSTEKARDCNFHNFSNYILSHDGRQLLILRNIQYIYRRSYKADVYHVELSRNKVEPLSDKPGKVMIPTFSPDGRMVAFVRDGNIFIKKFDYNTEVQVTDDALPNHIINGITDWVYEEEFEVTNLMSWSADSKNLAYVKTNESDVSQSIIPFYCFSVAPYIYKYKYPRAGSKNSQVSVLIYNVFLATNKPVKLPILKTKGLDKSFANSSEQDIYYIPRIKFFNNNLVCMTLNRNQNIFSMYSVNPGTLLSKLILQDRDKCYIEGESIKDIQFLDNEFIYPSERDGYNHLYLYSANGVLKRKLTNGKWDVTAFYGMDKKGNIYVQTDEESPLDRAVYMIAPSGNKVKLSTKVGTNNATFSDNFEYYINRYSNVVTPTITAVYQTGKNKPLRILENNASLRQKMKKYDFPKKEFVQIPNGKGDSLNAWIVKPLNFDPNKKYPVLMVQYSGPGSQEVLNRFSIGWEYVLASQGYIVVDADGRGTGGRGAAWQKCTYLNLGVLESDDQIAVAKRLGELPYVDKNRIGIWGWSFGGYMTLMCMTRGNGVFSTGIAVAPVTDWRFYDTVYTERYMRTPKENPEGYRRSSPLAIADKLKGNLLIIFGSADDNVQIANSMNFTERLIQANIPFEEAIYPDCNHSIYGGNTRLHLYTRMLQYLNNHLKNNTSNK